MASGQTRLDEVEIVVLRTIGQFGETLAVQQAVWGFADADKVPSRMFSVATHIGGLALGAYQGERMVGFSLGMPGRKADGSTFLHSHMTGLIPEAQGLGLGERLKLRQREEALKLGYRMIEWTFDPLESRNAYFNIEKLGVRVGRYVRNIYGITTSKLHGGLPTDRLVAEWRLDETEGERGPVDEEIEVPADVRSSPERAAEVQERVRVRFQELFAQGYVAVRFRRSESGGAFGLVKS